MGSRFLTIYPLNWHAWLVLFLFHIGFANRDSYAKNTGFALQSREQMNIYRIFLVLGFLFNNHYIALTLVIVKLFFHLYVGETLWAQLQLTWCLFDWVRLGLLFSFLLSQSWNVCEIVEGRFEIYLLKGFHSRMHVQVNLNIKVYNIGVKIGASNLLSKILLNFQEGTLRLIF